MGDLTLHVFSSKYSLKEVDHVLCIQCTFISRVETLQGEIKVNWELMKFLLLPFFDLQCFGADGKLVLHYCKTQAWG